MKKGEFQLIDQCFRQAVSYRHALTLLGNGDDASVHQLPEGQAMVVSTDMAVAGVHWPHDLAVDLAAYRALVAAVSDLAAMGAEPAWCWLTVMAADADSIAAMAKGAARALNTYHMELAGGDTVHADMAALNACVAGLLPKHTAMHRSGAKPGDILYCSGALGLAACGLSAYLQDGQQHHYWDAWLTPRAHLDEGRFLREAGITCCIDVSDGLVQDAQHLATDSAVHISIQLERVPGFACLSEVDAARAPAWVLQGGEDYVLLFTAAPNLALPDWACAIGSIEAGKGLDVFLHGQAFQCQQHGYQHF